MTDKEIIKSAMEIWRGHAILREGYRNRSYLDSLGKLTIGIGHLVLGKDKITLGQTISDALVMKFFEQDSKSALNTSIRQAKEIGKFNPEFLAALISVNYQLGDFSRVFTGSYPKLVKGDWQGAIQGIQRSKWNKQTPVRVADFVQAITKAFS